MVMSATGIGPRVGRTSCLNIRTQAAPVPASPSSCSGFRYNLVHLGERGILLAHRLHARITTPARNLLVLLRYFPCLRQSNIIHGPNAQIAPYLPDHEALGPIAPETRASAIEHNEAETPPIGIAARTDLPYLLVR